MELTKIGVTMVPDLLQLFQFLNLKIHLIQQIIQQILFINNFVGLDLTTKSKISQAGREEGLPTRVNINNSAVKLYPGSYPIGFIVTCNVVVL